jgi:hypothetical protein
MPSFREKAVCCPSLASGFPPWLATLLCGGRIDGDRIPETRFPFDHLLGHEAAARGWFLL